MMKFIVSAYLERNEFHGCNDQCSRQQLVDGGAEPRPTDGNDAAAAAHDELFDDDVPDLNVHGAVWPTSSKSTDKTTHCGRNAGSSELRLNQCLSPIVYGFLLL